MVLNVYLPSLNIVIYGNIYINVCVMYFKAVNPWCWSCVKFNHHPVWG